MTTKLPLVSIIIPVYNGKKFVRDAINSALAQDYSNYEVIVVNDGSTDNTEDILKSYGNKITFYTKKNGGVSSALNYGISKMRGEYFSWLSHDDLYAPNKLSAEVNYLKEHRLLGKKVIAFSDFELVDVKARPITKVIANHDELIKKPELALLRGLINGNSLLIPKSAFDDYGGFSTKLKCTQDYEKWLEMSETYRFVHVPGALVCTRYHRKQVSNTSPLVPIEGNALYLKMLQKYDDDTKIRLDGNVYSFYSHMADFLKYSPYDKAYEYCQDQLSKLPKEPVTKDNYRIYDNTEPLLSDNKIIKFFQFAQREGLKSVINRIKTKLTRG